MIETKTKLELFLEWYLPKLEAKCPGKGPIASEIVKKYWDAEADKDCGPVGSNGLDSDGMHSAFGRLGQRKQAFCNELRALKG